MWIALAADLTTANAPDNERAPPSSGNGRPNCVFCCAISTIATPHWRPCALSALDSLWPPVPARTADTRLSTQAPKCAAFSISPARSPSKTSMKRSRASLMGTAPCTPVAEAPPNALPWARSACITHAVRSPSEQCRLAGRRQGLTQGCLFDDQASDKSHLASSAVWEHTLSSPVQARLKHVFKTSCRQKQMTDPLRLFWRYA